MTQTAARKRPPITDTAPVWYLPQLLRRNAGEWPNSVALREKRFGIWQDITWADYLRNTERVAYAFAALGVSAGDRVGIQSENRPEWLYADVGSAMLRAAIVGFYPTNPTAEVRYLLEDSGVEVLVAEDQEQVDKAMELLDEVPNLSWVIYLDGRGLSEYDDPRLLSIDDAIVRGEKLRATQPNLLDEVAQEHSPDDLATLIYTSGTTGPPRGAMLTARNISFGADVFVMDDGMFGPNGLCETDVLVSYLPLSHVVERAISTWGGLASRTIVHFAESIDTVVADLAEVQPTALFAVPRIWEKIEASVAIKIANASPLKRLAFRIAQGCGKRSAKIRKQIGGVHTVTSRLWSAVASLCAFRKLRRHLGLAKIQTALSGAAPMSTDVMDFFLALDVVIAEAYGMTENTAVATANLPGNVKIGTVGEVQPGTELKIDDDTGEVLTRHAGTFLGYWHQPEATAAVLGPDGWLHTGDVGEWVDGTHVRIIDRIKDIIITAGGKNISPSEIENAIKASPYIREAVVIGDQRPYLTALIGIEFDTVADWAARHHIEYTTYRDLATKPETVELVTGLIRTVNQDLARVETVRKFRMLHKELDHEDGELTATQKLKRTAFAATVPEFIEDMYDGTTELAGGDLGRNG